MNKRVLKITFSVIFTFSLLLLLSHYITFNDIIKSFRVIRFRYIIIGFFFHLSAYFSRNQILYLFFKNDKIKFKELLIVHFIHNFYSQIIPVGLGELSFPILLKGKLKLSKSISVLFILRLLTSFITLILFILSIFFLFPKLNIFKFEFSKTNLLLLMFLFLILLFYINRRFIYRIIIKFNSFKKIIEKIINIFIITKSEITKFKNFKFLLTITFLGLLSNLSIMLFYNTVLYSLDIKLNFFQIIFITSIGLAFLILPIKSIGGFGTTEGSWAIGLILMGIEKETAIQTGFIVHILALVNITFLFLIGMITNFFKNRGKN